MFLIALRLFLIFIVLTLILLGIGLGVIRNLFRNRPPNDSKIQADIQLMRTEISPWAKELAPIDEDGLALFSLKQVNQVLKKGINKSAKGVFTSIYQEPLLAYSYKEYLGDNGLLYARSAEHEIVYKIKRKNARIAIDGQFFGTLGSDGVLRKGKDILGRIDKANPALHLPIYIGNKEVAALNNPKLLNTPEPRAFQYVSNKVSAEEEKTLLALSALKLVQQMLED